MQERQVSVLWPALLKIENQVLAFTPSFNNYEIKVVCSGSVVTNSGEGMASQIHLTSLFPVYPL